MKICIYGNSASGKSTLADKLSKKTGIQAFHLDQYHWGANWQKPELADFRKKVEALTQENESWIIEGAYWKVADILAREADIIILIQQPALKCVWRALKRQLKHEGQDLPFMAKDCPVQSSNIKQIYQFLTWVYRFDSSNTPKFLKAIAPYKENKTYIKLTSNKEIDNFALNIKDL